VPGAARAETASRKTARVGRAGRACANAGPDRCRPCRVDAEGIALPATHLRLGSSDAGVDPPGTTTRKRLQPARGRASDAGRKKAPFLRSRVAKSGDKAADAEDPGADQERTRTYTFVPLPRYRQTGQVARSPPNPRTEYQGTRRQTASSSGCGPKWCRRSSARTAPASRSAGSPRTVRFSRVSRRQMPLSGRRSRLSESAAV